MCLCSKKSLHPHDKNQIIGCLQDLKDILKESDKQFTENSIKECLKLNSLNNSLEYVPYVDKNKIDGNIKVIDKLIKALSDA